MACSFPRGRRAFLKDEWGSPGNGETSLYKLRDRWEHGRWKTTGRCVRDAQRRCLAHAAGGGEAEGEAGAGVCLQPPCTPVSGAGGHLADSGLPLGDGPRCTTWVMGMRFM